MDNKDLKWIFSLLVFLIIIWFINLLSNEIDKKNEIINNQLKWVENQYNVESIIWDNSDKEFYLKLTTYKKLSEMEMK